LSDRLRWQALEEDYVDKFHIYRTNRVRFFKGSFEAEDGLRARNAVESCQVLLYTDDEIDALATNEDMMTMIGLLKDKNPVTFGNRLKSVQAQMRQVRRDVGLFLSQCLFDSGNPGTSANWLDGIARKDDVDRWRSGKYLLGRSFESRKEYDLAIEQYQQEGSNQIHGNLIRARLLKAAIEKAYPGASDSKPATADKSDEPAAKTDEDSQTKKAAMEEKPAMEEKAMEDKGMEEDTPKTTESDESAQPKSDESE